MVLLHQEAFISCWQEGADKLRTQGGQSCSRDGPAVLSRSARRTSCRGQGFEKALSYPPAKVTDSPGEVIRSGRLRGGLVLPHLHMSVGA
jgi:hypothetical protein